MKKILLFSAIGMVTFYSCKKDDKTITVTNTEHDTITNVVTVFASGKINADSLATNITLAHSTKVSDSTFPAASADANAPVLDSSYSKKYKVIRSRYLTVYPPNVSGYVAGYYVQIVGSKSYFKVDYPAAAAERKAAMQAKPARLSNGRQSTANNSSRGSGEGNIDSILLFKLPASVHGDTFYIRYAAYDLSNRVSNPLTAMVVLLPEGNEATTTALTANWRFVGDRSSYNGQFQNDWNIDTGYSDLQYYDCNDNVLSESASETQYYLPSYIYSYSRGYKLDKYSMLEYESETQKYLQTGPSSCSNLVYYSGNNYYDEYNGGYSYDPATKQITFIRDGNSNLSLDSRTYYLSELTGSTMILSRKDGQNPDDNYTKYRKYIKQ